MSSMAHEFRAEFHRVADAKAFFDKYMNAGSYVTGTPTRVGRTVRWTADLSRVDADGASPLFVYVMDLRENVGFVGSTESRKATMHWEDPAGAARVTVCPNCY